MGYWGYHGSAGEFPVHGCSCSPVEWRGRREEGGGGHGAPGEKVIGREERKKKKE